MPCKLTSNITNDNCAYAVAGIKAVYLFNYDPATTYERTGGEGEDANYISKITLPASEKAYIISFIDSSASFTDEIAVNGNGGKYRTHTVNFTLENYDYQELNQGDALSLGRFVAVVVDKSNRAIILGRNNGLTATAFNYASGAADADATGWTVTMAGTEIEIGQRLENEDVIRSITDQVTITP